MSDKTQNPECADKWQQVGDVSALVLKKLEQKIQGEQDEPK